MIILQRFIKASVSRQGRGSRRATSGFGKKESTIDDYVDVDISGAKDRAGAGSFDDGCEAQTI
jgi:hypothetical protein